MVQRFQRPSVEAEVTAPVRLGMPLAACAFVLAVALRIQAMPARGQERVVVQVRAHQEYRATAVTCDGVGHGAEELALRSGSLVGARDHDVRQHVARQLDNLGSRVALELMTDDLDLGQ